MEEVHEYYDAAPAVAVPSPRGAGGGAREGRVGGVGGPYVNLSVDSRRRIASILATRRR